MPRGRFDDRLRPISRETGAIPEPSMHRPRHVAVKASRRSSRTTCLSVAAEEVELVGLGLCHDLQVASTRASRNQTPNRAVKARGGGLYLDCAARGDCLDRRVTAGVAQLICREQSSVGQPRALLFEPHEAGDSRFQGMADCVEQNVERAIIRGLGRGRASTVNSAQLRKIGFERVQLRRFARDALLPFCDRWPLL